MANKKKRIKNNNNKYNRNDKSRQTSQKPTAKQSPHLTAKTDMRRNAIVDISADVFGDRDKRLLVNGDEESALSLASVNSHTDGQTDGPTHRPTDGATASPHGLTNLGNTCYFNSVLQVLSQTHILYDLLNDRSNEGVIWTAKAMNTSGECFWRMQYTEEMDVSLPYCSPLTHSMVNFLREMRSTKGRTITPSNVLKEIKKKWSQFGGYSQQDSHELLRCLLDSLKIEEIKRQRKGIINSFNLGNNTSNFDDDTKAKCKAYAPYSSGTLIDSIFGGQLLASITCEECSHTSQSFESFFDISLPIVEDNCSSQLKSGQNDQKLKKNKEQTANECLIDEDSKNLTPKERKAKRQQKKAAKRMLKQEKQLIVSKNSTIEVNTESNNHNKSETDNDVIVDYNDREKNNELNVINNNNVKNDEKDMNKIGETDTIEDMNILPLFDDIDISDNKVNIANNNESDMNDEVFDLSTLYNDENEESYAHITCSENILEDKEIEDDINEKVNISDEFDDQFNIAFNSSLSDADIKDVDNDFIQLSISDKEKLSFAHNEITSTTEYMKTIVKTTLLPITSETEDDTINLPNFALLKCLSRFTTAEKLVDSNKYLCEICTKNNSNVKQYCNASKKSMIAIPPPILTLHLKRFESDGYRRPNLRKINQFVSFPAQFDLSPFVSKIYNFITPLTNQSKSNLILYSLYGVVEHSGTLRSGHYTAYIKLRPSNTNNLKKFTLLEPFLYKVEHILKLIEENEYNTQNNASENSCNNVVNGNSKCEDNDDMNKSLNGVNQQNRVNEHTEDINDESGSKWYHISDSSVSSSSLSAVLRSQAYILFYERIV